MSLLNVGSPSAAWPYIKAIAKPLTIPGTTIGLAALTDLQDDLADDQFQDRILKAIEGIHAKSSEIAERLMISEGLSVDADTLRQAARLLSEEIYLKRLSDKYYHADFKGIAQVNRLLSLPLDDVFVDLKVVYEEQEEGRKIKENALKEELESSAGENKQRLLRELEAFDSNQPEGKGTSGLSIGKAMKESGAFVLLGGPGSGKTTLVKRLARSCALGEKVLRQRYSEMSWGFPVVIPITQFATQRGGKSLMEYVEHAINEKGGESLLDVYRDYWMSGKVLLLLDGLDEVADVNKRISSARAIDEIIQAIGLNRVLVSTRRIGYALCRLSCPAAHLLLKPFTVKDIEVFVVQWHVALEKANKGGVADIAEARRIGHALNVEIQSNESVTSLASNPLMLTIIALIKHQQIKLPDRRVELYDIALRTLIQSWNLARSLSSVPAGNNPSGMEDTREIWAVIAYWMHCTANREVLHDQIYEKLVDTLSDEFELPKLQASQTAQSYLSSASETSGLLEARGPATYAFVHQSFQEYLSALFLAKPASKAIEKIKPYSHDPRWHEVIRLAAGHLGVIAGERDVLAGLLESLVSCDAHLERWLNNSLRIALGCLTDQVKARQKQIDLIISCAVNRLNGAAFGRSKAKLIDSLSSIKAAVSPDLEEQVLILLDNADWEVRQEGLRILARSESLTARSIERVSLVYMEDKDIDVKSGAGWVLWRLGIRNRDIAKTIFIGLGGYSMDIPVGPDPELKAMGVDLLLDPSIEGTAHLILGALYNWPADVGVIAVCFKLISSADYETRSLAAELLGKCIEQPGVKEQLLAGVNDQNELTRASVVRAISRDSSDDFIAELLKPLSSDISSSVRSEVVDALARQPEGSTGFLILKDMLSDKAPPVRLRVARRLVDTGDRELAISTLVELTHLDEVRNDAMHALVSENSGEWLDEDIWKLFEESSSGGIQYIMLLVESRKVDATAKGKLIQFLAGENEARSRAALFALSRCDSDVVSRLKLLELLTTGEEEVMLKAIKVLMHWPADGSTISAVESLLVDNIQIIDAAVKALMTWALQDMVLARRLLLRISSDINEELLGLFVSRLGKPLMLSSSALQQLSDILNVQGTDTAVQMAIKRNLLDNVWNSFGS